MVFRKISITRTGNSRVHRRRKCCNFVVEPKTGVDDRKFSWSPRRARRSCSSTLPEILHRSMAAVFLQRSFGFELHDGRWVSGVLVGVDDLRVRMVWTSQCFGSESAWLPRCRAWRKRRKSMAAPVESTARYKYTHLPLTRI